jgi:mono/diheme cytochrome c family protein
MTLFRRKFFQFSLLTSLGAFALTAIAADAPATEQQLQFFESQVRPILERSCFKCHGAEAKIKGGLRLTSRAGLLKGGDTGPAISLDDPSKSLLLKAISYKDEDLQMPPKEQLPKEKIAILTQWVNSGAPWPAGGAAEVASVPTPAAAHVPPKVTPETMKFWSYQAIRRPTVPQVKDARWIRNPIDNFILAKLEASGLAHAGPAAKTALIRRAYYDLTGLAPTPQEVDAFVADNSADAYERIIDRLLASPQYGEKWGRHWLDVVRFAETNSFERDGLKPNAWKYRDYVIDSFNKDKPYDQFVREQIAGDEAEHPTPETIIATGFYRLGAWDDEPSDKLQARFDELDDIVTTVGQGFMGMTMNCCRCHDHKIDPIPQKDYYSLVAFFQNITPYQNGRNIQTEIVPDDKKDAHEEEVQSLARRKEDLRKRVASFEGLVLPKLTESEKADLDKPRKRATLLESKVLEATNEDELRRYKELRQQLKELEDRKESDYPEALSVKEISSKAVATFILKRGNASSPGDEVQPAFPEVLSPPKVVLPPPRKGQKTTGLRTQLANWLTSDKNPLVARVIVNRLWEHHFGRGIVRSPNDFGFGGDKPTHPELLDYLASELVARGWHLKAIHKLIMTSSAYQMSSAPNESALAKDPQNDLFWRFDMRRLTAEEFRDSILQVTGRLNLKMGGPGIYPTIPAAILAGQSVPGQGWSTSSPQEATRRSVYIHIKRSLVVPILSAFDAADTDFSCPARFTTTQATQSLMLLNSDMMNDEAKAFANRLKKEAGASPESQVRLALRLALSREPTSEEITRGISFMQTLKTKHNVTAETALDQFALLVLNLNEFVYLD